MDTLLDYGRLPMDPSDKRSMQDLVKNALGVQDACNLSGVVHDFSRDISRLRALLEAQAEHGQRFSTDRVNRHPVCVLYSSKIAALSGSEVPINFVTAYDWCKKASEGVEDLLTGLE